MFVNKYWQNASIKSFEFYIILDKYLSTLSNTLSDSFVTQLQAV